MARRHRRSLEGRGRALALLMRALQVRPASRRRMHREGGQALILFVFALPALFAIVMLVLDGGNLLVQRRNMQVAADAAALAATQELNATGSHPDCTGVKACAELYSSRNGGPSTLDSPCGSTYTSNCYTTIDVDGDGRDDKVEVRLKKNVSTFLGGAVLALLHKAGSGLSFDVAARAVAGASPITTVTPGSTVTSTVIFGGSGAVAFTKSTDCNGAPGGAAIQWSGAQSHLTALMTNGGIDVSGNAGKSADHIALGKKGVTNCELFYGSPTPDPASFPDVSGPFAPLDWPVTPPVVPTPPLGCTSLGSANVTINNGTWKTTHPSGIYCLTGSTALLTIGANGVDFIGYTFFAPAIDVQSKNQSFSNAPPPSGQPPTVFDAYNGNFTMSGQSDSITGDIFATKGTVVLSGGGASTGNGGDGFIETLKLLISGNFAAFNGTGPTLGSTTTTTTTTTPGTTSTTGTDIELDE